MSSLNSCMLMFIHFLIVVVSLGADHFEIAACKLDNHRMVSFNSVVELEAIDLELSRRRYHQVMMNQNHPI